MSGLYPTRLSHLLAPVCVGVAVWCAAGIVSVASATDAARVVAPAPWWVLVGAIVVASLVPGWRRSPVTAVPALLSTLPWWPVPLPTAALLWTGPMAWLPILAALAAGLGSGWLVRSGQCLRAHEPRRASVLVALLTMALGSLTLWSLNPRLPGGDEPHYLVITQSLWLDGDLRIENNHTQRDYAEYFSGELRPDYINRGQDREIYSIHAPGVSALVLPGYVVFGLRGAQLTMLLCLVLTGVLVWRLSWGATGDSAASWFAWASVMGATTTMVIGVMVFPEPPAAVAVAAGVWLLVGLAKDHTTVSLRQVVAVSAGLAALPWLHTRFSILAAGLGLAILIALPRRRMMSFLAIPVLSAIGWFLSFWLIYGTLDPRAPYRGAESIRDWIWGAVVGLFADQQFGLLTFAPVLVVAAYGAWRSTSRPMRLVCGALVIILVGYTVTVSSYHMWWAGLPGLPARFLTATLPLLAVPLAIGWARATLRGRTVMLALLSASWLMTTVVVAYDHGAFAFNFRDGQAAWLEWLSPVVNLPRAWPSFFWRSQGAFLTHVAAWIAVWGVGWLLLRASGSFSRVAVAMWMLCSLMVSAEVGWRLNGVTGLDPSRSQLAIHAAERTWSLGAAPDLVVRADEAPLSDRPTAVLLAAGPVPAGEYLLGLDSPVSQPITVTVRIGRSREPLRRWALTPADTSMMVLSLPAGATVLVVEADSPEAAAGLSVFLRPAGKAIRTAGVARAFAIHDDTAVYFFDDNVFVEPAGFWIRGGRETHAVWSAGPSSAGRTRVLRLRNGGGANEVTVTVGGWSEAVPLEPWQEHLVTLPTADATGTWRVSIRSSSGFRPSEMSGGTDDRYLGVWVGR
jgi:hypothetical protein